MRPRRGRKRLSLRTGRTPNHPPSLLCRRRLELDISQEDIALRARISQGAYSKYERGLRVPDVRVAFEIARILDIDPAELLRFFKIAA